jgi:iron(III) transport system permease protein
VRRLLPFAAALLVLGFLVAWPQLRVLAESFAGADGGFSLATWRRFLDPERPAHLLALWNSAWLSAASVALAAAVGVPLALLIAHARFPFRGTLAALAVLPLLLPPIVGVLTFKQFLFGEYGMVPRALERLLGVHWHLDGFSGILALHAYAFFPLFYLFVAAGRKRIDPALHEAGAALGAGGARLLRRVTLPLLAPALAGAAVLVLLNAMGSFSAPLFFAPHADILTLQIYNRRSDDPAMVAVLATVLALAALLLLIPLRRFERKTDVVSAAKGRSGPPPAPRRTATRVLLGALAAALIVVLLLPHLSILVLSFGTDTGATDSVLPSAFTLENYRRVLSDREAFLDPMTNSLAMASLAAAANVAVGLLVAWLLARPGLRRAPRALLELLAYLPLALPATVIAFNLLRTFSEPHAFTFGRVLAGTWLLLPLAYFVRHLPIAVRATQSALATLEPTLVDAAESLGASRPRVVARVVVPLLLPGILSGAMLCFLAGISEFVASIMIYTADNFPIGVAIYNARYNRALGEPAALSVLLLATQALIAVAGNRFLRVERAEAA